jgi:hypothetical protein
VKAAKWYTVIADEVSDVSNKEQLSIVLRYVDSDTLAVREDLVGFTECDSGTSGRSLAAKITTTLEGYGLQLSDLRGQAYDGAGNMAGVVNGTAALITAQHPLAMYLHCASHCLNLAVVKSLEVVCVRNMMGVIGKVYQFFAAHPKQQGELEKAIFSCEPTSRIHKLKDMCRTRWVQRIDTIEIFKTLHKSVAECMENIYNSPSGSWNADSRTDARALQIAITTTDFLCSLVITNSCLKYIQALTTNLQAESQDIVSAVKEIETVIATIQETRDNVGTYHDEWFKTVESMCSSVGTFRSNTPADTPNEFYCRTVTIPQLDHILSELRSRFGKRQQTALSGLSIIPSVIISTPSEDLNSKVKQLADLYEKDLQSPECLFVYLLIT